MRRKADREPAGSEPRAHVPFPDERASTVLAIDQALDVTAGVRNATRPGRAREVAGQAMQVHVQPVEEFVRPAPSGAQEDPPPRPAR